MTIEYTRIKDWAEDDRPREKLKYKGCTVLSDAELLAILLRSGSKAHSALDLAKEILKNNNNQLQALGKMSVDDFCAYHGIGEAKAVTLVAALEIGRRRGNDMGDQGLYVKNSQNAYTAIAPKLSDLGHEQFWVILLSRSNKILTMEKISQGGITGTVADVRIIFKLALQKGATAVIFAHNHPSGNLKPSQADISLTKKLCKAADLFDIQVIDHIIVGDGDYYSFADEGVL